jgi:hypothetical protein
MHRIAIIDEEHAVTAELNTIDAHCVEALKQFKDEQDLINHRIKTMDELKATVAEAVYLRVRSDYVAKRNALLEKAKPLLDKARNEYARLLDILNHLEVTHDAVNLDRQEIELRHQLGEFDSVEYQRRIQEINIVLGEKTVNLDKAKALRERFLCAVRNEHELLTNTVQSVAPTVTSDPSPNVLNLPKAAAFQTQVIPAITTDQINKVKVNDAKPSAVAEINTPEVVRAVHTHSPLGTTSVMPAITSINGPNKPDATVMFRAARLVPQNPEAGKATYTLVLKPIHIGSDDTNEIRITGTGIETRHAQIKPTQQGYLIIDNNTKLGTRVNAERIKERILQHEDVVQVGSARFVFRSA